MSDLVANYLACWNEVDADARRAQTRFRWGLGPAGAEPVVIGSDVVVTDARDASVRSSVSSTACRPEPTDFEQGKSR